MPAMEPAFAFARTASSPARNENATPSNAARIIAPRVSPRPRPSQPPLADGFIHLATAPGIDGDIFNLGCGREVSMRDLATLILDLMGNPVTAEFGALPERPIEIYRMHADTRKTTERVGWTSKISLEDGLERTIAWYRENLAAGRSPFAS